MSHSIADPETAAADQALMTAVAAGDVDALGELFDRYGSIVKAH